MTHNWSALALAFALSATAGPAAAAMGENLIYVPVPPCRIVNTLNGVGGSLQPDTPRNLFAWGTTAELTDQGGQVDCPHPKEGLDPVAIAANVTAVGKQASGNGNIVAYPAGGTDPGASLVNFTRSANIANATVIKLCDPVSCPADGDFALEANFATVPAIVDVQGYFYPKEMDNILTVSTAGGDFDSPLAAMDALAQLVTDDDPDKPGPDNHYLVHIGPGTYELRSERLKLIPGVTLKGSGRDLTTLQGAGGGTNQGVIEGADDASVRDLTVKSSGGANAIALYNNNAAPTLEGIALIATGADTGIGMRSTGAGAVPVLNAVLINASANTTNIAVRNQNQAHPVLSDANLGASGGTTARAVHNTNAATTLYHSIAAGELNNESTSTLWFATGVLDGSATGTGFTCAFVVDGSLNPLGGDCLKLSP